MAICVMRIVFALTRWPCTVLHLILALVICPVFIRSHSSSAWQANGWVFSIYKHICTSFNFANNSRASRNGHFYAIWKKNGLLTQIMHLHLHLLAKLTTNNRFFKNSNLVCLVCQMLIQIRIDWSKIAIYKDFVILIFKWSLRSTFLWNTRYSIWMKFWSFEAIMLAFDSRFSPNEFIWETQNLSTKRIRWRAWNRIDNLELFEHLWTPKRGLQNKNNKILRFFGSTVKYWYRGSVIHLNTARGPF